MMTTIKNLKTAFTLLLLLSLITGVIYPVLVTGLALLIFPHEAKGSLVSNQHTLVGSELIAQKFTSPRYFSSRPSAADYATLPSGASNLGPTSEVLRQAVTERLRAFGDKVPVDLLTTSASGLDPHLSPAAAAFQIDRIIQARSLGAAEAAQLAQWVDQATEGPQLGFLGKPRVNVLRLNLLLDRAFP